jgi:glycine cleavage system aminomethyltransferase T
MWNGAYAGYASATAFSPRVGSNIAVAMVNCDVIDAGERVAVHTDVDVRQAEIVPFPII